jgi:hypothetical protein
MTAEETPDPILCSLSRGGSPVVDQAQADEAALLFNPDAPRLAEPDDADLGLWLIVLPGELLRQLDGQGFLQVEAGPYTLVAETP